MPSKGGFAQHAQSGEIPEKRLMGITVIICTHNRANLLRRTLAFLNQARRPATCQVEILVIANACTDDSAALLDNYIEQAAERDWLPLRWQEEWVVGKSNALNHAISLVRTPVIAMVDDDHRVDEGYLLAICQASKQYRDASIFCGRILPDWTGEEPAWIHDEGQFAIYPLPVPRYENGGSPCTVGCDGPIPGGGNLFLRRAIFDRVGKFNTALGPKGHNLSGGEDMDFVLRALKAGERLQYVPDVLQYHVVEVNRLKLGYIMRKSFSRSQAPILVKIHSSQFPPRYLWGKLVSYFLHVLTSLYWPETRFYLIRTSAALGELVAYVRRF